MKNQIRNFVTHDNPVFYAYYASQDWVLFTYIFGGMMKMPDNYPMYVRDMKQILDEYEDKLLEHIKIAGWDLTSDKLLEILKSNESYPKQDPDKEHNALEDAKWNQRLYEYLKSLNK